VLVERRHCLDLGVRYLDLQRTDDRNHDGAQCRSSEAVVEVFAIVLNAAMHSRCLLGGHLRRIDPANGVSGLAQIATDWRTTITAAARGDGSGRD
jgi:hypothetical protein